MAFIEFLYFALMLFLNLDVLQVVRPLSQVISSLVDQDNNQMDQDSASSDSLQKSYSIDEFEVRIFEPEKSGGHWEPKATIPMQTSENALTVRNVILVVSLSLFIVQSFMCLHFEVLL